MFRPSVMLSIVIGLAAICGCESQPVNSSPEVQIKAGNGQDGFFPVMVWAQDPALAEEYKAIGVNTFFSLYNGPTEEQLAALKAAGLYTICAQNEVGLAHKDAPTIIAWMHGDEPDNRQSEYDGKPVPLEKILTDYQAMKKNDPTRPVVVNFGQGTTNEKFAGRAIAYDQYAQYARGADIVSYDFYPVSNYKDWKLNADGVGQTVWRTDGHEYLWMVPRGIRRLQKWTDRQKPVFMILECTAISHPRGLKVNPHQLRAQTWMSLIAGAKGICWFVHQFEPNPRNVAQLLSDPELKQAVSDVNHEILALAAVLNQDSVEGIVEVASSNQDIPIDYMVKKHDGKTYIFAVGLKNGPTVATFTGQGLAPYTRVKVMGEDREIRIVEGAFTDPFEAYSVRKYVIE